MVVMPVYNEAESIGAVLAEWIKELRSYEIKFKILVLDDGSNDSTGAVVSSLIGDNPEINLESKPNSGHGATCLFGYRKAIVTDAPWVFQIDSDGQCDPVYFKEFWRRRRSNCCIQGVRTTREDGALRVLGSRLLRVLMLVKTGLYIEDANCPYRLMDNKSLSKVSQMVPTNLSLSNVFLSYFYQRDYEIDWIPINFRRRSGGQGSQSLSKSIELAIELISSLSI